MKYRLQKAGLLFTDDADSEIDISVAWGTLSRLGYPARYSGKALDGSYEYVVIDPKTGCLLATGKGATLESAMCEAALNTLTQINAVSASFATDSKLKHHNQVDKITGENHEVPIM